MISAPIAEFVHVSPDTWLIQWNFSSVHDFNQVDRDRLAALCVILLKPHNVTQRGNQDFANNKDYQ